LGLNWVAKNSKEVYVEIDFEEIIKKKEEKIIECGLKKKNHYFVGMDILQEGIYFKIKDYLKNGKRTLIVAEGVVTYFNKLEFDKLIGNISEFLDKIGVGGLLLNDKIENFGRSLRRVISFLTVSKSYSHFSNGYEARKHFLESGFERFRIIDNNFLIYLVEK